jgi:hypothetical protein
MVKNSTAEAIQEEPCYVEYGLGPEEGKTSRVVKSFLLPTCHGPLTSIPVGSLIRVSEKTGNELFFSGRVEPLELSETFEVLHEIRSVDPVSGEWLDAARGDIIRMTRDEAMPLLVQGMIKERTR